MTENCAHLHEVVRKLPRLKAGFDPADIPKNGIYFLFETGEFSHAGERIVRVGTHTGQNNLSARLMEHLYAKNKDRSVFRKHIGRCLLRRDNHSYTQCWEYDLTKRAERNKYAPLIDSHTQAAIENDVTEYMNKKKEDRLLYEERLIGTIMQCNECAGSAQWLGKWHPNTRISKTGLWNIQGQDGKTLSCPEIDAMFGSTL